jgi:hypothetical protein
VIGIVRAHNKGPVISRLDFLMPRGILLCLAAWRAQRAALWDMSKNYPQIIQRLLKGTKPNYLAAWRAQLTAL